MNSLARAFFDANPSLRLAALGASGNDRALDLEPFGVRASFFGAERRADLVARYRDVNALAFPAELALPGWVLADLYLMPGAIGMLLGPASLLDAATRARLGLAEDDEAICAAYVAAPTVVPGAFVGVSLLSIVPRIGAGAWIKALTLRMLRARRLRGVAQWSNTSLRAHTRMGSLRVVSAVPGAHELGARSFVYETELAAERAWSDAMQRRVVAAPTERIASDDVAALAALVARAEAGEEVFVVPPGLDEHGNVLVVRSAVSPIPR